MCKASQYLNELDSIVRNIDRDYSRLSKKQSEYDLLLSDQYHKIELANFNACEGFYLTKQLQEILRKRRVIKDEMLRLESLRQTINIGSVHNAINKSKKNIEKHKKAAIEWKKDWKHTYTLEELVH